MEGGNEHHHRQIQLARGVGEAEAAADATRSLTAGISARLTKEDFAEALVAELRAISQRQEQIAHDLTGLAFSTDPDVGWGDERYRLANRGQTPPDPAASASQIAAIERAA